MKSSAKRFLGAGLIGAFVLTGCSFSASVGGASLDPESVEAAISNGFEEVSGLAVSTVDCSGIDELDVETGAEHTCTATIADGQEIANVPVAGGQEMLINVTLTDDEGGFTWMAGELE